MSVVGLQIPNSESRTSDPTAAVWSGVWAAVLRLFIPSGGAQTKQYHHSWCHGQKVHRTVDTPVKGDPSSLPLPKKFPVSWGKSSGHQERERHIADYMHVYWSVVLSDLKQLLKKNKKDCSYQKIYSSSSREQLLCTIIDWETLAQISLKKNQSKRSWHF